MPPNMLPTCPNIPPTCPHMLQHAPFWLLGVSLGLLVGPSVGAKAPAAGPWSRREGIICPLDEKPGSSSGNIFGVVGHIGPYVGHIRAIWGAYWSICGSKYVFDDRVTLFTVFPEALGSQNEPYVGHIGPYVRHIGNVIRVFGPTPRARRT